MPKRLSDYLKEKYGEKIYRLSLSSGCSCPNRDGSICYDKNTDEYYFGERIDGTEIVTGGCIFCSEGGSGEFAAKVAPIEQQIENAKARISPKSNAKKFIAYFQSYTNTYGDVECLRKLYTQTIIREDIAVLSIGTRPDCLGPEVMEMLKELNAIKPVWVELGLQTIHEKTAKLINRGYKLKTFEEAYQNLKNAGISVIVHVILGLPGEKREDMFSTVKYLAQLSPTLDGIKLQNLQILKGTRLYDLYRDVFESDETAFDKEQLEGSNGQIKTQNDKDLRPTLNFFTMEEYTDLIAKCLNLLPEETVVHRMTGDGPRWLLVEPLWTLDKKRVLNMLTHKTAGLWS